MEYGAIDLHKKESQIRIVTESGETVDRRIATTRDRFTAVVSHCSAEGLEALRTGRWYRLSGRARRVLVSNAPRRIARLA
jgi:hypothetical protein